MLRSRRQLTLADALRLWGEKRKPRPCNRPKDDRRGEPFPLRTNSSPKRTVVLLVMTALMDGLNRSRPDGVN